MKKNDPPPYVLYKRQTWWQSIHPNLQERITSEINLAQFPKQSSAIGFASPCKKTLMKARLVYRNGKNATWINWKNVLQSDIVQNGRERTIITSRSSFPPMGKKRRISRGYCGGNGSGSPYQYTRWAMAQSKEEPLLGHGKNPSSAIRGQGQRERPITKSGTPGHSME